jgi:hypothetical protein
MPDQERWLNEILDILGLPRDTAYRDYTRQLADESFSDEPQDLLEHLPWHRDLGHLDRDVAAIADDLGADIDQLLPQTRQGPRLRCRGTAKVRMKLPRFAFGQLILTLQTWSGLTSHGSLVPLADSRDATASRSYAIARH